MVIKRLFIRQAVFIFLALLLLLVSGCTGDNNGNERKDSAASYEIVDSTGTILKMPQRPERIVSLSVSTDEILIGLVPTQRIAALTYRADDGGISNITEQAKAVSARVRANAENIIALRPDLVIIPAWQPVELILLLRGAGIPVYVYKAAATIDEVKQSITSIAQAVGEEQAGQQIVNDMDNELAQIAERVRQVPLDERKVVINYTLMGVVDGIGSTFDDICRYAGVVNGAASAGLKMSELLTKEEIVAVNPDVILLPTWDYGSKTDIKAFGLSIQTDPALQSVTAIRRRNLISVPDSHLACSSQYIVQGVRDVAKAAYPQYFNDGQ